MQANERRSQRVKVLPLKFQTSDEDLSLNKYNQISMKKKFNLSNHDKPSLDMNDSSNHTIDENSSQNNFNPQNSSLDNSYETTELMDNVSIDSDSNVDSNDRNEKHPIHSPIGSSNLLSKNTKLPLDNTFQGYIPTGSGSESNDENEGYSTASTTSSSYGDELEQDSLADESLTDYPELEDTLSKEEVEEDTESISDVNQNKLLAVNKYVSIELDDFATNALKQVGRLLLDKKVMPNLIIPDSSQDLLIAPHLLNNTNTASNEQKSVFMSVIGVYEILRRFRSVLRLSPFRFETFCAALTSEEYNNSLLSEIFISLLKTLLREDDLKNTWYGPQDLKDSINITLYSIDAVTWPELVKIYLVCAYNSKMLSHPDANDKHMTTQEFEAYLTDFLPSVDHKLRILSYLCDLVLSTNAIRNEMANEGLIKHDDVCRVCHKVGTGVLICCETCSAVYHLGCSNPPLEEYPEEDWVCSVCKAQQIAGVTDCIPPVEKNGLLIRHEPIGVDRHSRKYWYLCRRIVVEDENGKICYYSSRAQLHLMMLILDGKKYEKTLVHNLKYLMPEIEAGMDITQRITNLLKANKLSYFDVEEAILSRAIKDFEDLQEKQRVSQININDEVSSEQQNNESEKHTIANSSTRGILSGDKSESQNGKDNVDDNVLNDFNKTIILSSLSTTLANQYGSNLGLLFRLGEEMGFKSYVNQYSHNLLALTKSQQIEERDKRRYLSNKFPSLTSTTHTEFKWAVSPYGSASTLVPLLRCTMIQIENKISPAFMHGSWKIYRDKWVKAIQMCTQVKDFAFALAIFECAIRPAVFNNTWHDGLGHTRLRFYTQTEREESKRLRHLKEGGTSSSIARPDEDEPYNQTTWIKYSKFPRGLPHSVWKMKGEEYRLTGQHGWIWVSCTRLPTPRPPFKYKVKKDVTEGLKVREGLEEMGLIDVSAALAAQQRDALTLYPEIEAPTLESPAYERRFMLDKMLELRTRALEESALAFKAQKTALVAEIIAAGCKLDPQTGRILDEKVEENPVKTEKNDDAPPSALLKAEAIDESVQSDPGVGTVIPDQTPALEAHDKGENPQHKASSTAITTAPYINSFVDFLKTNAGEQRPAASSVAARDFASRLAHIEARLTSVNGGDCASTSSSIAKLFASCGASLAGRVRAALGKKAKPRKVYSKLVVPLGSKFISKRGRRFSILILPEHETKRLARYLNHYSHTSSEGRSGETVIFKYPPKYYEAQGFSSSAKPNHLFWPYTCPRPTFKTAWRYRTWRAESLCTLALQLKIMWYGIQWDDMWTKPPLGGIQTLSTEEDIATTEILKRTEPIYPGQEAKYLVRKIVIPLTMPPAAPHSEGPAGTRDYYHNASSDYIPPQRTSSRVKKVVECDKVSNPSMTETWVNERQLALWQIQLFADKLEKRVSMTNFQEKSKPVTSTFTNIPIKMADQIKIEIETQLKQQALRQSNMLNYKTLSSHQTNSQQPQTPVMLNFGTSSTVGPNTNILRFVSPSVLTQTTRAQGSGGGIPNLGQILKPITVSTPGTSASRGGNYVLKSIAPGQQVAGVISSAQLANFQRLSTNSGPGNPSNPLQIRTLLPGQQVIRLPDGRFQIINVTNLTVGPNKPQQEVAPKVPSTSQMAASTQQTLSIGAVPSTLTNQPSQISGIPASSSFDNSTLNPQAGTVLTTPTNPTTLASRIKTPTTSAVVTSITSKVGEKSNTAEPTNKKFELTPAITQKILRQAMLNTTDPSVQAKLLAFQRAHQTRYEQHPPAQASTRATLSFDAGGDELSADETLDSEFLLSGDSPKRGPQASNYASGAGVSYNFAAAQLRLNNGPGTFYRSGATNTGIRQAQQLHLASGGAFKATPNALQAQWLLQQQLARQLGGAAASSNAQHPQITPEEREHNQRLSVAGLVIKSMLDTIEKSERRFSKGAPFRSSLYEFDDRLFKILSSRAEGILIKHKQSLRKDILKKRNILETKLQNEIQDEIHLTLYPQEALKRAASLANKAQIAADAPSAPGKKRRSAGARASSGKGRNKRKRSSRSNFSSDSEDEGDDSLSLLDEVYERASDDADRSAAVLEQRDARGGEDGIEDEGILHPLHKTQASSAAAAPLEQDKGATLDARVTQGPAGALSAQGPSFKDASAQGVGVAGVIPKPKKGAPSTKNRGKINMFHHHRPNALSNGVVAASKKGSEQAPPTNPENAAKASSKRIRRARNRSAQMEEEEGEESYDREGDHLSDNKAPRPSPIQVSKTNGGPPQIAAAKSAKPDPTPNGLVDNVKSEPDTHHLMAKVQEAISKNKKKRAALESRGRASECYDYYDARDGRGEDMDGEAEGEEERTVYCVCRTPYDATKFYIGCDKCSNWFHGDCVKITPKEAKLMASYVCEECKIKASRPPVASVKKRKPDANAPAPAPQPQHRKPIGLQSAGQRSNPTPGATELYCICKQPYDESQFYIGCDRCQDWFHGKCVGVLPSMAIDMPDYVCPNCRTNKDKETASANEKYLEEQDYGLLTKLLKQIKGHPSSWPFQEPVDPRDAPDYYVVIKEPIDLKKIERKIYKHQYKKLLDFVGDITKMFDNCRYYNAKDSPYYECAEILESFFSQKLKNIRKQQPPDP